MLLCQIIPQSNGSQYEYQETNERNVSSSLDGQFISGHTEQRVSEQTGSEGERTANECDDECSQEKCKSTTQADSIEGLREHKSKLTSVDGYVNEIALNNRAQTLLGSVQVVWRQVAKGSNGLKLFNQRQLQIIDDVESTEN